MLVTTRSPDALLISGEFDQRSKKYSIMGGNTFESTPAKVQSNASRVSDLANKPRLQAHHHNNASERPVTGQTEINSTQDDLASRGRSGFDTGRTTMPSKIILVLTLAIMAIAAVPASAKASPAQYAQCAWAQCY